jgi:hypothetical protein
MSKHSPLVESWLEEFRTVHGRDERNAVRQTFEDYWSWIKVFLDEGGAGQRGWLEQGDEVLAAIRDQKAAKRLRARVHDLGKAIATEWAKENRSRRVYSTFLQGSPNLRDWGKQLQRAAAADAGDGDAIGQALDAIERELKKAVQG